MLSRSFKGRGGRYRGGEVVVVVVVPALLGAKHAETKDVSDQVPPLFVGVSVSS